MHDLFTVHDLLVNVMGFIINPCDWFYFMTSNKTIFNSLKPNFDRQQFKFLFSGYVRNYPMCFTKYIKNNCTMLAFDEKVLKYWKLLRNCEQYTIYGCYLPFLEVSPKKMGIVPTPYHKVKISHKKLFRHVARKLVDLSDNLIDCNNLQIIKDYDHDLVERIINKFYDAKISNANGRFGRHCERLDERYNSLRSERIELFKSRVVLCNRYIW